MNGTTAVPSPRPVPLALVVDADRDTRALHALTLEPLAVEIQEAEDGADALARVAVRPPQLVVAELRLPRIDGVALCSLLRNDPATHDATILLVAASARPVDIERARRAGADDVLVKPVDPEEVREHARQLIARAEKLRTSSAQPRAGDAVQLAPAPAGLEDAERTRHRTLSRTHARETTVVPPTPPPRLRCPSCDQKLTYDHSYVGGVSAKFAEQWDYFTCARCGTFQYRHRTRRLRRV